MNYVMRVNPMSERVKNMFKTWDEEWCGFDARVKELYDAMVEGGPSYVNPWMQFSDQMIEKLENSTLDEYDEWRISTGCVPLFRSVRNKGKDALLDGLRKQREIDVAAYHLYMTR